MKQSIPNLHIILLKLNKEKAMFKKVKEFLAKRADVKKQKVEMVKMQEYYTKLQGGALLIQYIYEDMKKASKSMNRQQRRRFDNDLKHKGKFNEETVRRYLGQVNEVLTNIEEAQATIQSTMVSKLVERKLKELKK